MGLVGEKFEYNDLYFKINFVCTVNDSITNTRIYRGLRDSPPQFYGMSELRK